MAEYFSHDYNARNDPKLLNLQMAMGTRGLGIFWCVVEMLYEQGGSIPLADVKGIAHSLHEDAEGVEQVILDYGLFENDGQQFWSASAKARIQEREELSRKKSEAGKKGMQKRWSKSKATADLQQTDNTVIAVLEQADNTPITIKENKIKGKEIKENNITPINGGCGGAKRKVGAEEFLNSQINKEKLCKNLAISGSEYDYLAKEIINEWNVDAENQEWSWKHFQNTMRIKINNRRSRPKTYAENKAEREAAAMELIAELKRNSNETY